MGSAGRLAGFLFSGLTSPRSPPRARGGQAVSRTRAGVLLSWAPRVGFLVLRFFLCFAWSGLASFFCLVPPRRGKVDGTAEAMVGEGEVQSNVPRSGNTGRKGLDPKTNSEDGTNPVASLLELTHLPSLTMATRNQERAFHYIWGPGSFVLS